MEKTKNFALRISNKKVYSGLEKQARIEKRSVNTLINIILEDYIKKVQKKPTENLV